MLKTIKMAGFAAAVTLGGLMSFSAPSIAQDVEFMIGPDGVRMRTREFCEDNPYDRRCRESRRGGWDRDGRDRDRDGEREGRRGRREAYDRHCSPDDALNKAERMGVRRARIVDVGRRSVDVAGRWRGDRVVLTFGAGRGCPLIRS